MNGYIAYHGYIQKNNIGDEAIYLGATELFSDFELIQEQYLEKYSMHLYGGGTLLPPYGNALPDDNTPIASVGAGVRNPEFRNRPYSKIDIGYFLGKIGISNSLLRRKPMKLPSLILSRISDSITAKPHYLTPDDFKQLERFDYVGVRGPISADLLSEYGITAEVTGDTALILEPDEYHDEQTGKIAVTLRDRGAKWGGETDYVDEVRQFCRSYADEFEFVFIPFRPRDIPLHIELSKNVAGASVVDFTTHPDVEGVLNLYSECDVIIGERLHASVLAACTHTPFISLAYRPKNMDFSESVSMNEFTTKLDAVTEEWLEKTLMTIVDENVSDRLANEVERLRTKLRDTAGNLINQDE